MIVVVVVTGEGGRNKIRYPYKKSYSQEKKEARASCRPSKQSEMMYVFRVTAFFVVVSWYSDGRERRRGRKERVEKKTRKK